MDKCVVLCSGGVNSAVLAALAREDSQPFLLHVRLPGPAATRESECITQLAAQLGNVESKQIDLPYLAQTGPSAADGLAQTDRSPPIAISGPLSAAAAWAAYLGARRILLGVGGAAGERATGATGAHHPDTSGMFDCSHDQAFLWNQLLSIGAIGETTRLDTPLMDLSKAEIIRLGVKLNVPFDQTWSCKTDTQAPCATCVACVTRASGFLQAGLADPAAARLAG